MTASASRPISYHEHEPPHALRPWLAALWTFRVDGDAGTLEHAIPPTGGAILGVRLAGGSSWVGPTLCPLVTEVRGGDRFVGAHVWPGAARALFPLVELPLRDRAGPLADLLGAERAGDLERRLRGLSDEQAALDLVTTTLTSLAATARVPDPTVRHAIAFAIECAGDVRVAELAARVGLSTRQLLRRFAESVELTPKEFLRLQRVRSCLVDLVATNEAHWADLALRRGFADQAHLAREVQAVLGRTLGEMARHLRRIDHGPIVR